MPLRPLVLTDSQRTWRVTAHAMAMPFKLTFDGPESSRLREAAAAFEEHLRWADQLFSLYREDSWISQFNLGLVAIDDGPPELLEVLQTCEWYRGATEGAFDARSEVGLDPTGLVKGWAVARGTSLLDGAGVAWMVDAAGDVLVSGRRGDDSLWRVGIADPRVAGDPAGKPVMDVVELGENWLALATSGGSQRAGHIWDPESGQAAPADRQVSVLGKSIVDVDVWATAIAARGAQPLQLAVQAGMEVLVMEGLAGSGATQAFATPGWPSAS